MPEIEVDSEGLRLSLDCKTEVEDAGDNYFVWSCKKFDFDFDFVFLILCNSL